MHRFLVLGFLVLASLLVLCFTSLADSVCDVTNYVEKLGNPLAARYTGGDSVYARNIWDLQLYDGRIYLGSGNSSNLKPAPNMGPVPVWYYDLRTARFGNDYTVNEEQIERFRIIDHHLTIPGHDPRDDWSKGNYYQLQPTGWVKYRTIPGGLHCYDLYAYQGKLFVALGHFTNRGMGISEDGGKTWRTYPAWGRQYSIFELNGELYTSGLNYLESSTPDSYTKVPVIYKYGGNRFKEIKFNGFPKEPHSGDSVWIIARPTPWENQLIYIAAANVNDHQWTPQGLYLMSRIDQVKQITLPNGGKPWDILVRDGKCYVLSCLENGPDDTTISVCASRNPENWKELFRFKAPTFARSFELANGDFYFGLGCETAPLSSATGEILRVSHQVVPKF